jgi:hypothetical protein
MPTSYAEMSAQTGDRSPRPRADKAGGSANLIPMNKALVQALLETLSALDDELAAARARVDQLGLERQGVEAALKRFQHTSPISHAISDPTADKETVASDERTQQTDSAGVASRVLDLLRTAGGPLRNSEIAETLNLDPTQARSAVAYLHRSHRVRHAGRGLWQTSAPTNADTPVPAGVSAAPASGPGGDDDQTQAQDHRHDLPGRNGIHQDRTHIGA